MSTTLQNSNPTFHLYLVDGVGAAVSALKDTDLIIRATRDQTYIGLVTPDSFIEVNAVDEPGLYYLTLPASLSVDLGQLYITIRPVALGTFADLRLTTQVEASFNAEVLAALARIEGLGQSNYRLDQQTYDTQGNLTLARVQIFGNAGDAAANTNPLSTYQINAVYDTSGRLIDYLVTTV